MVELKTLEKGNEYGEKATIGNIPFVYRKYLPVKEKLEAASVLYPMRYKEDDELGLVYETIDGFVGDAYIALKYFTNIDIDEALKHASMEEIYDSACYEMEDWMSEEIDDELNCILGMVKKIADMRREVLSRKNVFFSKVSEVLRMLPTQADLDALAKEDSEINRKIMELFSNEKKQGDGIGGATGNKPAMPKLNFAKK